MRRKALEELPRRYVSVQFYNRKSNRILEPMMNLYALPRKQYPIGEYGSVWESVGVKVIALILHFSTDFQSVSMT